MAVRKGSFAGHRAQRLRAGGACRRAAGPTAKRIPPRLFFVEKTVWPKQIPSKKEK